MIEDYKFEVGSFIVFETGEYSERGHSDPVRVLKPFTAKEVADEFMDKNSKLVGTKRPYRRKPDSDAFLPWLVREGYVEDVGCCVDWHIDSYGTFEPF